MHKFISSVNQYKNMKTISISKKSRSAIKEFAEEKESVNDTVTRLLENAELSSYSTESRRTTIQISEENLEKLKSLKTYPTEPLGDVIFRLISECGRHP